MMHASRKRESIYDIETRRSAVFVHDSFIIYSATYDHSGSANCLESKQHQALQAGLHAHMQMQPETQPAGVQHRDCRLWCWVGNHPPPRLAGSCSRSVV